ncbi:hypothetical protein Cgig2_002246 [Carnegiea gigantea]|uniref:Uncharacterized protein n=1 Tax=Carnegiea gigantea TaxID=171969 RepID=A0A9Q1KTK9_9CARY|nr:hypothetical protein Cgig2_002246 [Carnegiea gigantea]
MKTEGIHVVVNLVCNSGIGRSSVFAQLQTWAPKLTKEVKEGWLKVVGKNLRNLVNKAVERPDDKPIVWLSEEDRERLKAQRSDPKFQKKSAQCLKNTTEGPNATLHCQGSISTAKLARRMIKEEKTHSPSALFARSHKKYEALRVERGIKEGTQEAEKLYYEVAGG